MKVRNHALLIIGMKTDPVYPSQAEEPGREEVPGLITRIRKLEEEFLKQNYPVIYVSESVYTADYRLKKTLQNSAEENQKSDVVDGLLKEGIIVFERRFNRWNADQINMDRKPLFYVKSGYSSNSMDYSLQLTALHELLYWLGIYEGGNLYLVGIHTSAFVRHTAVEAWFRGFRPYVISDCTDAFSTGNESAGTNLSSEATRKIWHSVDVVTSRDVVDMISTNGEIQRMTW
jgi:nicotinamidase-related amidase